MFHGMLPYFTCRKWICMEEVLYMNVELTGYKENSVILVYTVTAIPGCNLMIQVIFAITNLLDVDSNW